MIDRERAIQAANKAHQRWLQMDLGDEAPPDGVEIIVDAILALNLDIVVEDGELSAFYVCDLCGQPLHPDSRCNSGVHQGPDDPNGARGRPILTTELAARLREQE